MPGGVLPASYRATRQSDFPRLVAAVRGVKVILRVYQSGHASGGGWERLDAMFLQVVVQITAWVGVCTANGVFELRKLLVHVLLVYAQHPAQRDLLRVHWLEDPARCQQFCQVFASIIGEAHPHAASERDQAMAWKAKARVMRTWSFLAHNLAQPAPELERQHGAAATAAIRRIAETLINCDATLVELCTAALDFEQPGLDDERDSVVWVAFERCAVEMLDCVARTGQWQLVFQSHGWAGPCPRKAFLAAQAGALLTRVLWRFLLINGLDAALLDDDSEEYANRGADEFRLGLSCPHGFPRMEDCDRCQDKLDHGELLLAAGTTELGSSTARSAAMCAMQEVITLTGRQVVPQFLGFVTAQLNTAPAGDEAAQAQVLASRGAALRALAVVVDKGGKATIAAGDGSHTVLNQVVEGILIPETTGNKDVPFAAHLRCVGIANTTATARLLHSCPWLPAGRARGGAGFGR